MAEQQRFPSTQELANKALLESDEVPARRNLAGEPTTVYAPYATESTDTSAYVGVSPEYMTYASDTEKPLRAEEGVEADMEEVVLDGSKFAVGTTTPVATDADTSTVGSGASSDLVYTASSGENFTAEKVVPPAAPEVKKEEVDSEPPVVTVPQVQTEAPKDSPVEPANTADSPADTPPTPVGEKNGATTKSRSSSPS